MTTEQADLLKEDIQSRLQSKESEAAKSIEKNRIGYERLERYVLPHMPRSLGEHFTINFISFYSLNTLRIDFNPRHSKEYPAELVLGTLGKVKDGLVRGGWTITSDLVPRENYGALTVVLSAKMEVKLPEPHTLRLDLSFEHLKDTEHCRIEEKEVTVEAVPEHMEIQLFLVCDEEGWDK